MWKKRFEYKFFIDISQKNNLLSDLNYFMEKDKYSLKTGHYFVNSLYFDTFDFICYKEKAEGVSRRTKFRIRNYEPDINKIINSKFFQVQLKKRVGEKYLKGNQSFQSFSMFDFLNYNNFIENNCTSIISHFDTSKESILNDFILQVLQQRLKPVSLIRYDREAYIDRVFDIRITLDQNILCSRYSADQEMFFCPIISSDLIVLEYKFNDLIPHWMTSIAKKYGIKKEKISKYEASIERLYNFL